MLVKRIDRRPPAASLKPELGYRTIEGYESEIRKYQLRTNHVRHSEVTDLNRDSMMRLVLIDAWRFQRQFAYEKSSFAVWHSLDTTNGRCILKVTDL